MKDTVVVFGGAGFLGSHVADQLTLKGYNVLIFDKIKSPYLKENQEMIIGDIENREHVKNAIKNSRFVYHFAAIADINKSKIDPVLTLKVNTLSTLYILDACREFRVERIIFGSTIYVYSQHGSFYRSSKQASELFIENYQQDFNLKYTILRYGSLYGPRANDFNFINNIIIQAIKNKKVIREGDGEELREYIHVIDAARASVNILDATYENQNIIITGDRLIRVRDLLLLVKEIFENKIEIEFQPSEKIEHHYNITPYAFKPRIAKKYLLKDYYDLGQGLLDLVYKNFKKLKKEIEK